ncbi:MAG: peptide chain release factor N(5)-glutamine methyltransferase [Clostridia bacterium]|nr:peptide chain release factor N(5)-glutamine methyltransferase [Clostridia bacterium]
MKIKELIMYGKNLLTANNIEDANLISKLLAEFILNMSKAQILVNDKKEISEDEKTRYYLALIEIIQGMPIQYITNNQEFMKLNFYVDKNVLIPQPDTEILVEEVINIINDTSVKVLDICTGSGCIGTSIAKYTKNTTITMSDISSRALNIAKSNYIKNMEDTSKVQFIQSDMFKNIKEKYDIIVSNPPYIESKEINKLEKQVQNEPHIALDGGEDGLQFYRKLANEAHKFLNENGYLCMEIGYNQKQAVIQLLKENKNYKEIYSKKDLSGNDRMIIAKV